MTGRVSDARVAVVIPVYRSIDDVAECLRSIRHSGEEAGVIVVDDFSGDGTAEMVERDFREVVLVRRPTNGGFAAAVNTGLSRLPSRCGFVAVLNSDTIVEPGWLNAAVEVMQRDETVGCVAPRVVTHDDPAIIDSAGQAYTISGWAYLRGHNRRFGPPYDEACPVLGATGCAAVFRRRALDGSGGAYREDLICYYEDVELAFRLQRAGWGCLYVPGSVVRHKVSRSYGRLPTHKAFYVSRNLELIFWEFMPRRLLWRAVWDHLLLDLLHGTNSVRRRQGLAYFKGKLAFLARCGETWRRRRRGEDGRLATWVERRWLPHVARHRSS